MGMYVTGDAGHRVEPPLFLVTARADSAKTSLGGIRLSLRGTGAGLGCLGTGLGRSCLKLFDGGLRSNDGFDRSRPCERLTLSHRRIAVEGGEGIAYLRDKIGASSIGLTDALRIAARGREAYGRRTDNSRLLLAEDAVSAGTGLLCHYS